MPRLTPSWHSSLKSGARPKSSFSTLNHECSTCITQHAVPPPCPKSPSDSNSLLHLQPKPRPHPHPLTQPLTPTAIQRLCSGRPRVATERAPRRPRATDRSRRSNVPGSRAASERSRSERVWMRWLGGWVGCGPRVEEGGRLGGREFLGVWLRCEEMVS